MPFNAKTEGLAAALELKLSTIGKTTVGNVRDGIVEGSIYCGRANASKGLAASVWGNPFRLTRESEREAILAQFRPYLLTRPDLLARLPELRGRLLLCWCHPKGCHCDTLADMADNFVPANYIKQRLASTDVGLWHWMQDNLTMRTSQAKRLADITEAEWFDSLLAFTGRIKTLPIAPSKVY